MQFLSPVYLYIELHQQISEQEILFDRVVEK